MFVLIEFILNLVGQQLNTVTKQYDINDHKRIHEILYKKIRKRT